MVNEIPGEVLTQRLQEFAKLWQKYMDLFNDALEAEELHETQEKEFMNMILEITRRAKFLEITTPDGIFDLWKDVRKLISQTPSLEILKKEVPIRISNFKSLWHETSISLNQKQGQLRTAIENRDSKKKGKKK